MSTNEDIENAKMEARILASALEVQRERISKTMEEQDNNLAQHIKVFKEVNVMLQSVPTKLADKLEHYIPEIVKQLKSSMIEELNIVKTSYTDDIVQHANFLRDSENRIQRLSDNMANLDKKRIKMFFLGIIISSVIAVSACIYGASYMMQTFPTRVTIDNPENIILYDSNVSLWGTDNVKVLKGLKKNDKKNSRKY